MIILFLYGLTSMGQAPSDSEDLKEVETQLGLPKVEVDQDEGQEDLELLQLRAKTFMHQFNVDLAKAEYNTLLLQAKYRKDIGFQISALAALASIAQFQNDLELTNEYAVQILEFDPSPSARSNAYTYLANSLFLQNDIDSSEICIRKAIAIDSAHNDRSSLPFNLGKLAEIQRARGWSFEAIDLYIRASETLRPDTDDFKMASLDFSIGLTFMDMDNLEQARKYISLAQRTANEFDLNSLGADINVASGVIAWRMDSLRLAKERVKAGLFFFTESGKNQRIYRTKILLSSILLDEGRNEEAGDILDEMGGAIEDIPESERFQLNLTLAKYQLNKGEFGEAEAILQRMRGGENDLVLSEQIDLKELDYNLKRRSGQLKEAIDLQEKLNQLEDEAELLSREFEIHSLERDYSHAQQEKELEKLRSENEFKAIQLQQQRYRLKVGLILGGLSLIFLVAILFQVKKLRAAKGKADAQSAELAELLKEKEVLLSEIEHRVKNNMQAISSLLRIQSIETSNEEAKEAVLKSRNRVKSLALVNQVLYTGKRTDSISAREYIDKLSDSIFNAYKIDKEKVKLVTDIEDVDVHVDTGIPLGLILNELLSNCLKFAFPETGIGEITIRLKEVDKKLILEVEESGASMTESELKQRVGSFGTKMIEAFKNKLEATLTIDTEGSNRVCLTISNFPVEV